MRIRWYCYAHPGSVLREGAANAGIDLVFPFAERLTFERDVLFPIAGLSASEAETNLRIHTLGERVVQCRSTDYRRIL